MKSLIQLAAFGTILFPLVVAETIAATAKAQPQPRSEPISAPHVILNVQRSSGTCPQTIGLWWFILPYEGGAEHTVVANTREFADETNLVSSNNKQFVEFVSPLRSNYASCVGRTRGQEYSFYNAEFKHKKAYFRVDLRKIDASLSLITYKSVVASRPYVRWAIAD
ncbi:MAG: hypothetical protein RM368_02280 [Nostoc sp. DedSLP03]|uniref:hypothetical protein n=1 Tax=Nostoc sp. DedSLP03 TaxID=3075400 RepID=UPI002AD25368|nr:hypothetical protein [Nostoc sp. DedSLP03]MDZ7963792.1 hypothetical protein [Nostoc sp. DedSLP03]